MDSVKQINLTFNVSSTAVDAIPVRRRNLDIAL